MINFLDVPNLKVINPKATIDEVKLVTFIAYYYCLKRDYNPKDIIPFKIAVHYKPNVRQINEVIRDLSLFGVFNDVQIYCYHFESAKHVILTTFDGGFMTSIYDHDEDCNDPVYLYKK